MAKTVTTPWDPADHVKTDEGMAAYLEVALEEGDHALLAAALGDIARQRNDSGRPRRRARPGKSLQGAIAGVGVIRQALLAMTMIEQLSLENRYD